MPAGTRYRAQQVRKGKNSEFAHCKGYKNAHCAQNVYRFFYDCFSIRFWPCWTFCNRLVFYTELILCQDINHLVLTKFPKNWSSQETAKRYALRSVNLLMLFPVTKNCKTVRVVSHVFYLSEGYSNSRGISILSTAYQILSNILLSSLTSYVDNTMWIVSMDCE